MWRLNRRWPHEPLVVFGFDFVVEAALDPIVECDGRLRRRGAGSSATCGYGIPAPAPACVDPTQRSGTGARSGFRRFLANR